MRSFFLLLILILTVNILSAQVLKLPEVREMFFSMDEGGCKALELSDKFDKNRPQDALLMAYFGAATAAAPACLGNPLQKINYFQKGKQLIAEAIAIQPQSFEIRFLRFATQSKSPSFLGYKSNLDEDKEFLLTHLVSGRKAMANELVFIKIVEFLKTTEGLSKENVSLLNGIISK